MKIIKKSAAVLLLLIMLLSAFGCGDNGGSGDTATDSGESTAPVTGPINTGIQESVGVVGKISTTVSKKNILFDTGKISFEFDYGSLNGVRNAANNFLKSKAGSSSEIVSSNDKSISVKNTWSLNNTLLTTDLILGDECVTVSQKASVNAGGIAGAAFCLKISDDYNVIVPAWNGVRLSKQHPEFWTGWTTRTSYGETSLQMQMIILEGKDGGAVIYADDDGAQYKAFDVVHSGGYFYVTVETIPQAPFTGYKSFSTVDWRIIPYEGDWTSGSAIYRDYVREKFNLDETDKSRPGWVDDIEMVFLTDLHDKAELSALASKVDASKVLLQVPDWRKNLYDVNWPDYTPRDGVKEMIEYAHSLGFRVQLHCNMNGCQMELGVYNKMKRYHMLDDFSKAPINEDFSDSVRSYLFAQMNPASSEWRSYVINAIAEAVKELDADAVHLDQSLLAYNDGNGYIDGITSLQGNVLYHKELAEALPDDVAIGGEGITDFNARYSSFLQSHVYGVDSGARSWSMAQMEQIVPLTSSVYTDVKTYQWPGLPLTSAVDYYLAWYLSGTAIGHLPTIMRENSASISSKAGDAMKMILNEANWYMENQPVRVFSDWDENTVMRWQLKNGGFAVAKRDKYGYVLLGDENDENSVVTRILYGTNTAPVSGTITDWMIYDENSIYGLDPNNFYIVLNTARSGDKTHITSITNKVYLKSLDSENGILKLCFNSSSGGIDNVTFTIKTEEKLAGVYSKSGKAVFTEKAPLIYEITVPISDTVYLVYKNSTGAALPVALYSESFSTLLLKKDGTYKYADTTTKSVGSFAGQLRKKITASVPAGSLNSIEYMIILPDTGNMYLELLVGTTDTLYVGMPVSVEINGKTVWSGTVKEKDTAEEISVSLDSFKGEAVFISLNSDARKLNAATNKIIWANPTISVKK